MQHTTVRNAQNCTATDLYTQQHKPTIWYTQMNTQSTLLPFFQSIIKFQFLIKSNKQSKQRTVIKYKFKSFTSHTGLNFLLTKHTATRHFNLCHPHHWCSRFKHLVLSQPHKTGTGQTTATKHANYKSNKMYYPVNCVTIIKPAIPNVWKIDTAPWRHVNGLLLNAAWLFKFHTTVFSIHHSWKAKGKSTKGTNASELLH
jgi:hypothetical protein